MQILFQKLSLSKQLPNTRTRKSKKSSTKIASHMFYLLFKFNPVKLCGLTVAHKWSQANGQAREKNHQEWVVDETDTCLLLS